MNTNGVNVALVNTISEKSGEEIPYRVITDKEEEEILSALRVLHKFTYTADRSKSRTELPKWDECGLSHYESICDRTFGALKRKAAADAQKVCAKVLHGVLSDIEAAREAEAVAFAEWETLAPAMRTMVNKLAGRAPDAPYVAPKTVSVRLDHIVRHFPKGTTVAQAYDLLTKEGVLSGGGTMLSRIGAKGVIPTLPNPEGKKGRPASDIDNGVIVAPRVPASDANGSTLPHGNGQRAEMSEGQKIAAARAQ